MAGLIKGQQARARLAKKRAKRGMSSSLSTSGSAKVTPRKQKSITKQKSTMSKVRSGAKSVVSTSNRAKASAMGGPGLAARSSGSSFSSTIKGTLKGMFGGR